MIPGTTRGILAVCCGYRVIFAWFLCGDLENLKIELVILCMGGGYCKGISLNAV